MKKIVVAVAALAGTEVLAGRLAGEEFRARLLEEVKRTSQGALFVLDFKNVLVTSSFFVAGFAWLWRSPEVEVKELYPVLANLTEESRDDVLLALRETNTKVLEGRFSEDGGLLSLEPVQLDELERETYELVEKHGEVRANDLVRINPRISATAWNNRLALLHSSRLVRREKEGRQFVYSPVRR